MRKPPTQDVPTRDGNQGEPKRHLHVLADPDMDPEHWEYDDLACQPNTKANGCIGH
jgi:hypothetical protein